MTSSIEREILMDVDKNPYSTRDQVRYRLEGHSPVTINRIIERLIDRGNLCYLSNRLAITNTGRKEIYHVRVLA